MNGIVSESGKVASGVVDALRAQPLALALVIINVLYLAAGIWFFVQISGTAREQATHRAEALKQLLGMCDLGKPNG